MTLGNVDVRPSPIDWRSGQPRLHWYATFAQRDAIQATAPR